MIAETVCPFGLALPHSAPVLPCWYCEGKDGDGQPFDPQVHHGWRCEACDERREIRRLVAKLFMRSAPFVTGHLGFWEGMGDVSLDNAWDAAKAWLDKTEDQHISYPKKSEIVSDMAISRKNWEGSVDPDIVDRTCPYCHQYPCVGHGNEVTLRPENRDIR